MSKEMREQINKIKNFGEFLNESNYYSPSKIYEYEIYIKNLFRKYFLETGLDTKHLVDIKTVGSFGTEKFINGKSDIDFMLYINETIDKGDMCSIIDFINSELINKFGEIENKGGLVEVIGINNEFWFD